MESWRSLRAILELKLPGFPNTKPGLRAFLANRPQRTQTGRGGAYVEYLVEEPESIRAKVESPALSKPSPKLEARRAEVWRRFDTASDRQKRLAQDRALALRNARGLTDEKPARSYPARTLRRLANRVIGFDLGDWAAVLVDDRQGRPRERAYSSRIG